MKDDIFLEKLLTEAEVCYFECAVMRKYVLRFDIPMHDIILIEVSEAVEQLLEVEKHFLLSLEPAVPPQLFEVAWQIAIVAQLQYDENAVVFDIADDVFDFDDVGVVPAFQQALYLLPRGGHYVLYLLHLGGARRHQDYLHREFVHSVCYDLLEVAPIDLAVGTCS